MRFAVSTVLLLLFAPMGIPGVEAGAPTETLGFDEAFAIDCDGDDRVDAVKIVFEEAIDDITGGTSNLNKENWTLEDPYGKPPEDYPLSVDTGPILVCSGYEPGVADDDTIWLHIDPVQVPTEPDTGATIKVTYIGQELMFVRDLAGEEFLPDGATIVAADTLAGEIEEALTIDCDGDGRIDHIKVIFSEAIADASDSANNLRKVDWRIEDPYGAPVSGNPQLVFTSPWGPGSSKPCPEHMSGENDNTIFLVIDPARVPPAIDTTLELEVEYLSGLITGAADDILISPGVHTATDGIEPLLLHATTWDNDLNDILDAMDLIFSEPVDDSTFKRKDWLVNGIAVDGFCTGRVGETASGIASGDICPDVPSAMEIDDEKLRLWLADPAFYDGGLNADEIPQLTYAQTGPDDGLFDLPGNILLNIGEGDVIERDGGLTRIVSATVAEPGSTTVLVEFSRAVRAVGGGDIELDDFWHHDDNGDHTTFLDSVTELADDTYFRVVLATPVEIDDLLPVGRDLIISDNSVSGGGIEDVLGVKVRDSQSITLDETPPDAVSRLEVEERTSDSIKLSWRTPANFDLDDLELRFSESPIVSEEDFEVADEPGSVPGPKRGSTQSYTFEDLDNSTTYYFAIRLTDTAGNEGDLSFVSGKTLAFGESDDDDDDGSPDTQAPDAIDDLRIVPGSLLGTTVLLEWDAPCDPDSPSDKGCDAADRYEMRRSLEPLTPQNWAAGTLVGGLPVPGGVAARQEVPVTGLAANTMHHFAIRSYDEDDNASPLSNGVIVETGEDNEKTPTDLQMDGGRTSSSIRRPTFYWNGDSPEYLAVLDGDPFDFRLPRVDQEEWRAPNLVDGQHTIDVYAIGEAVSQPATMDFFVDTQAPHRVRDIAVVDGTLRPNAVELVWAAPFDDGSPIHSLIAYGEGRVPDDPVWHKGGAFGAALLDLPPDATVRFQIRLQDEAGNLGPISDFGPIQTPPDHTAPVGQPAIRTEHHALPTPIRDVQATWTPATDPDSNVMHHAVINGEATYEVSLDDPAMDSLEADDLAAGLWYIHVRPRSAGGWGTQTTLGLEVQPVTEADLLRYIGLIEVTVKAVEAGNQISWVIPPSVPTPLGVQVWAGNSPYQLIADITGVSGFLHGGPTAGDNTRYLVTPYYDDTGLGRYLEGAPPESLQGATTSSDDPVLWPWFLLGGIIVLGAIAAVVVILLRKKKDDELEPEWKSDAPIGDDVEPEDDEEPEDDGWTADEVEPAHFDMDCPSCQQPFQAPVGETSVICPHCETPLELTE